MEAEAQAAEGRAGWTFDCDAGAVVEGLFSYLTVVLPSSQVGFINSLKFSSAGDFLVAGVGQEHRYEARLGGARVGTKVDTAGHWAWPQRHPSLPQAWPVVADQRGPELCLHHPSPQGPQAPGCWLLTPIPFI